MNLLLFSQQDLTDSGQLRIDDGRFRHLVSTLKSSVGDTLRIGEIGGLMGHGVIVQLSADDAVLNINLDQHPPEKLPLRLVLALPRPKMLRRILRTCAELGVAEIHLINSYRVEKSYWQTPALNPEHVRDYFLEGLQQACDTVLPNLHLHQRFKPFVEDQLPGLLSGHRALVAHPGAFPPCPAASNTQPTLIAIGPEGGWIPYEMERWIEMGCEPMSLGPRILRVETAVSSLLTRLSPA